MSTFGVKADIGCLHKISSRAFDPTSAENAEDWRAEAVEGTDARFAGKVSAIYITVNFGCRVIIANKIGNL